MTISIEDRVRKVISETLQINGDIIVPEAHIADDPGADSLDTVELVMIFEEEFDIEIPLEDADELDTVGKVISYIKEY